MNHERSAPRCASDAKPTALMAPRWCHENVGPSAVRLEGREDDGEDAGLIRAPCAPAREHDRELGVIAGQSAGERAKAVEWLRQ
jgi:hypothetical protein